MGQAYAKVCFNETCPFPYHGNHYHCGRCDSGEVTGMTGHWREDLRLWTCEQSAETVRCQVCGCGGDDWVKDSGKAVVFFMTDELCHPCWRRILDNLDEIKKLFELEESH